MYKATKKDIRKLTKILSSAYTHDRNPYYRCASYFDDHLLNLGVLPIKTGYQPMIDLFGPRNLAYKNKLTGKRVDAGRVTLGVSLYDEKRATFPMFANQLQSKVSVKVDGNVDTLTFLYFFNRGVFTEGSEGDQLITMDDWVLRFADYPVLVDEQTEASEWVAALKLLYATKDVKKTVLVDDRSTLEELRYLCFDAVIQNCGSLLKLHSNDLSKVTVCFNPNLLSPNEFDPERYLVNQFPMLINPGEITTSIEGTYTKTGSVVFDNSKNNSSAWVWLSATSPSIKADYAIEIPAHSVHEITNQMLGPGLAMYLNVLFMDATLTGKLKITVKKTKS
jgi:hypothetical protein